MPEYVYYVLAKHKSFIGLVPIAKCYDKQELLKLVCDNIVRGNESTIKICRVHCGSKKYKKYNKMFLRVERQYH